MSGNGHVQCCCVGLPADVVASGSAGIWRSVDMLDTMEKHTTDCFTVTEVVTGNPLVKSFHLAHSGFLCGSVDGNECADDPVDRTTQCKDTWVDPDESLQAVRVSGFEGGASLVWGYGGAWNGWHLQVDVSGDWTQAQADWYSAWTGNPFATWPDHTGKFQWASIMFSASNSSPTSNTHVDGPTSTCTAKTCGGTSAYTYTNTYALTDLTISQRGMAIVNVTQWLVRGTSPQVITASGGGAPSIRCLPPFEWDVTFTLIP